MEPETDQNQGSFDPPNTDIGRIPDPSAPDAGAILLETMEATIKRLLECETRQIMLERKFVEQTGDHRKLVAAVQNCIDTMTMVLAKVNGRIGARGAN